MIIQKPASSPADAPINGIIMGTLGRKLLCAWLVLDGIVWNIILNGVLPIWAPSLSASIPFPFSPFTFLPQTSGTPAADLFAGRALGWGFMLHGVVRGAAGLNPEDSTLAWLAASSMMIEVYFWASAHPNKTMFLPVLIVNPILAYLCATMLGGPAKNPKGGHAY